MEEVKTIVKDIYPSRGGRKAELVKRKDPIIHRDNTENAPVDEHLIRKYEEDGFFVLENLQQKEKAIWP